MTKVKKYILIASVKLLSITSTSFENRLTIRPRGVVSKKDIGARRVLFIAFDIIRLLASVPQTVSVNAKTKDSNA